MWSVCESVSESVCCVWLNCTTVLSAEINAGVLHDGPSECWRAVCVCVCLYGGCVIVGCQLHSRVLMSRLGWWTITDGSNYGRCIPNACVCMCGGVLVFSITKRLLVTLEIKTCCLFVPFRCADLCLNVFQVNAWRVYQRRMWFCYTPVVSGPQWQPTA